MKYLGVDFGLRRVGLATSEGELASSWKIIEGKGVKDLAKKVIKMVREESFDQIIVGMPEGKMGQNVKGFIRLLKEQGLKVEEADETLSTQRATQLMIEVGIKQKKRRSSDVQAACIILQEYLDNQTSLRGAIATKQSFH